MGVALAEILQEIIKDEQDHQIELAAHLGSSPIRASELGRVPARGMPAKDRGDSSLSLFTLGRSVGRSLPSVILD